MADSPITGGLSRLESGGGGQGDFSVLCWLLAVGHGLAVSSVFALGHPAVISTLSSEVLAPNRDQILQKTTTSL
jgi:hypothetical protein